MKRQRAKLYGLLAVIGLSTPMMLAVETALRQLLLPPEFEELRRWLGPRITPWVWGILPFTLVATAFGLGLQRWLFRRELAGLRGRLPEEAARSKAEFEALMLATNAPQLPALLATVGYMFGAALEPVLWTMASATAGVLTLGFVLPWQADRARAES